MELTKPAGCGLQALGGLVLLFGLAGLVGGSLLWGAVATAAGAWALWAGRGPAQEAIRQRRR